MPEVCVQENITIILKEEVKKAKNILLLLMWKYWGSYLCLGKIIAAESLFDMPYLLFVS